MSYVKPYRVGLATAIFCIVVVGLAEPGLAAMLKPTLDGSFIEKDVNFVMWMCAAIFGLFVLRGAASFASTVLFAWIAGSIVQDLRNQMMAKLVTLPERFFDEYHAGELLSKFTFDAANVKEATTHALISIIRDSIMVIGLLAVMFYYEWRLSIFALIAAPLMVLVVRFFSRRLRKSSRGLQHTMGSLAHHLKENIDGRNVIRFFNAQNNVQTEFEKLTKRVRQTEVKFAVAASATSPITQTITSVALIFIIYFASIQAANNELTVGTFASFFSAIALLFSPLKRLINVNAWLQKAIIASTSVFNLIDEISEADLSNKKLTVNNGEITVSSATFSYPKQSTAAIKGVSFEIAAKQTIGIVGHSGSGKTTLVRLLLRLYPLNDGCIKIDGINIQNVSLQSLRKNISFVSQDIVLFSTSLRDNIAFGPLKDVDDDQVHNAIEMANLESVVENLPDGIHSMIGESGASLSGGQRQRVAIARAFLKNAPILVFDEATASLDNVAEAKIYQSLDKLRENRTTIIIAHRLSTIERCDKVAIMSNGQLAAFGSHEEVLHNPIYEELYRLQSATKLDDR